MVAAVYLLMCLAAFGQSGDSVVFEAQTLSIPASSEDRCIQVGIFLTYRGPEKRDWNVLNTTMNYSAPHGLLAGAPIARLSDFEGQVPGLSNPGTNLRDHKKSQVQCKESNIVNSVSLKRDFEIPFTEGLGNGNLVESINPMTGRIELVAQGDSTLFSTEPDQELLFAVVTFPVTADSTGTIELKFVPDDLVLDGNVLIGSNDNKQRNPKQSHCLYSGWCCLSRISLGKYRVSPSRTSTLFNWFHSISALFSKEKDRVFTSRMKIILGIFFCVLSLVTGALLGRSLTLRFSSNHRKKSFSFGLFWVSLLMGAGTIVLYYSALRPAGVSENGVDTNLESPTPRYGPTTAFQLEYQTIKIPGAHRFEPRLPQMNVEAAVDYLELGVEAWNKKYKCIGCHVTGTYLLVRPMLTSLEPPSREVRDFTIKTLQPYLKEGSEKVLLIGHRSAQVVYAAAGLASWDRYVEGRISKETKQVLQLMFRLQQEDGLWKVPTCWPPLQSSSYQLAAVAALAVGIAPGWREELENLELKESVDRLRTLLRTQTPPHDYARVWLLWAESRMKGILEEPERQELVDMIWSHQKEDGGWSLRMFARPEEWGDGSRYDKLVSDQDFYFRTSDGHMTGLSVIVLREAGIPPQDPRLQKAMEWIDQNQRITGRWFSASLNTEHYHLLTFSATCFALLSQWKCNVLSRPNP